MGRGAGRELLRWPCERSGGLQATAHEIQTVGLGRSACNTNLLTAAGSSSIQREKWHNAYDVLAWGRRMV